MKRMRRIFAYFVSTLGVTLLIAMPAIVIPALAQDQSTNSVPGIQDLAFREIPPAMNLLSEIPISQTQDGTPAAQAKPDTQNAPSTNSALPQVQTFTGTVAKGSDGYFLQGPDGMSYRLDDGSKAGPYDGRKVQIVGRLELDTNLIHIGRIEPAP